MITILSKFKSKCAGCGEVIHKGTVILYDRIEKKAYHDNVECLKGVEHHAPDYFDMAYEDDCARMCGL